MNPDAFLEELNKIAERGEARVKKTDEALTSLGMRMLDIEQRVLTKAVNNVYDPHGAAGNLGMLVASDAKVAALKSGDLTKIQIQLPHSIKSLTKSVIGNEGSGTTATYPVPPMVVPGAPRFTGRRLSVLSVLPYISVSNTSSVNVPQLVSNSEGAAVQAGEGLQKAQTSLTFANVALPIVTVAHYVVASKQILSDAPVLGDFLGRVLIAGAMRKFENLVISGDGGAVDKMAGLIMSATAYAPTATAPVDALGQALTAMDAAGFSPDIVVLNPFDLFAMLSERTATGYVGVGWSAGLSGKLWGCTITTSSALAAGTALVIDSTCVAVIDREQANISIGTIDQQFTANLVTILCELRGGLAVLQKEGVYHVALPAAA